MDKPRRGVKRPCHSAAGPHIRIQLRGGESGVYGKAWIESPGASSEFRPTMLLVASSRRGAIGELLGWALRVSRRLSR